MSLTQDVDPLTTPSWVVLSDEADERWSDEPQLKRSQHLLEDGDV